jgi:hypothetical protein
MTAGKNSMLISSTSPGITVNGRERFGLHVAQNKGATAFKKDPRFIDELEPLIYIIA